MVKRLNFFLKTKTSEEVRRGLPCGRLLCRSGHGQYWEENTRACIHAGEKCVWKQNNESEHGDGATVSISWRGAGRAGVLTDQ